ncbi:MAG: hypothetical protein IPH85_12225 [Ignavibacteria bacterium]|nr:hypothetical protein [Ignavibacteria bacterium]
MNMILAVKLRKVEPDPVGADPEDVILKLRIPLTLGDNSVRDAVFFRLPSNSLPIVETFSILGESVGLYSQLTPTNPANTLDFIEIRRKHLPNNGDEVTIWAPVHFDYAEFTDNSAPNRNAADNNPRIMPLSRLDNVPPEHLHDLPENRVVSYDIVADYETNPTHSTAIEISSICFVTENTWKLLLGQFDQQIQESANEFIEDVAELNTDQAPVLDGRPYYDSPVETFSDRATILRFYGLDEILPMHWLSFRVMNKKLDGKLTTETGLHDDYDLMKFVTEIDLPWQGSGFTTHNQISSYMFEHGWESLSQNPVLEEDQKLFAGLRAGTDDWYYPAVQLFDDPDTYLGSRDHEYFSQPLPIPVDFIASYITSYPGGILASYEFNINKSLRCNPFLLFGEEPWLGQVWLQSYARVEGGANPSVAYYNQRPRSMSEARLSLWLPLILGAKGLMLYKGVTGLEGGQTLGSVLSYPPYKAVAETGLIGANVDPGIWNNDTPENLIAGNDVARDFIDENDPTEMVFYFRGGYEDVFERVNPTTVVFYSGEKTVLQTANEVLQTVSRYGRYLGKFVYPGNPPNPLFDYKLRGWYGRGFETFALEHPDFIGCIADRIGTVGSKIRTRHPMRWLDRSSSTLTPGHFDFDDEDSTFIDLSILSDFSDPQMSNSWIMGVINRRTDPRMLPIGTPFNMTYSGPGGTSWQPVTYDDWIARITNDASARYQQRGTREVHIPFNYQHSDGRYRLLRLRQLGGGIDTIIGQDREFALTLLPGEGAMFRVDVLQAEVMTDVKGFLEHNTQRKAIVYPDLMTTNGNGTPVLTDHTEVRSYCDMETPVMRTYKIEGYSDSYRYHQVYHHRYNLGPDGDLDTGPLTVWYRRSQPLSSVNANPGGVNNPDIQWEAPIALSINVRERVGAQYVEYGHLSCGYPSLVVRYDDVSKRTNVYAVFSCEEDLTATPRDILICEAVIPAEAFQIDQLTYLATFPAEVIGESVSNPLCTADRLEKWGTPVINASYSGNYYAWSTYQLGNRGIMSGFKLPHARRFNQQGPFGVPLGGTTLIRAGAETEMQAQFPSMHSYSKLLLGEQDASLVWQQGPLGGCETGRYIMTTRLHWDGANLQHGLKQWDNAGIQLIVPPNIELAAAKIAQVNVLDGQEDIASRPTIYRNQSEYNDAALSPLSGLYNFGYANHKADRIVWQFKNNPQGGAPGGQPSELRYRAIDYTDRCNQSARSTHLFASGEGSIFKENVPLGQPEILQGNFSQGINNTWSADPWHTPLSWEFDDTTAILLFSELIPENKIWQISFGWNLFESPNQYEVSSSALETVSDVRRLHTIGGLQPHGTARNSVISSKSLQLNRMFFERYSSAGNRVNYVRAPWISRTAEGFFKHTKDKQRNRTSKFYYGFRGDGGHGSVAIGGDDAIPMHVVVDDSPTAARKGQKKYVSDWLELSSTGTIVIDAVSELESTEDIVVTIERKSDGLKLPFNVMSNKIAGSGTFKKTERREWQFIAEPGEEFRYNISTVKDGFSEVLDVELEPATVFTKSLKEPLPIVDLQQMTFRISERSTDTSCSMVSVSDNPSHGEFGFLVQTHADVVSPALVVVATDGTIVRRVDLESNVLQHVTIDLSDCASGMYNAHLVGSNCRVRVAVVK